MSSIVSRGKTTWTLIQVLEEATKFLKRQGIDNPRLNAEQLLSTCLDMSRVDLYLHFEKPLTEQERDQYKGLLRRRCRHEPLQYIQGEVEFMSLPFKVNKNVLIPRPETELLVEKVIEDVQGLESVRVLDIGVGSGNIAVSLAKNIDSIHITGIDVSQKALDVAKENTEKNSVADRISLIRIDMEKDDEFKSLIGKFHIVVSNPPYVSKTEWENLPNEIKCFEPKVALCDGGDGFSLFRIIAEKVKKNLLPNGLLYFEVGDHQSRGIQKILIDLGYTHVNVFRDLNGIERVVRGTWNENG